MPHLTKAHMKGFMDELAKMGDKHVAKALNKIVFQPDIPAGGQSPQPEGPPNPNGGADMGAGQSNNVVGGSNAMSPSGGPGGV